MSGRRSGRAQSSPRWIVAAICCLAAPLAPPAFASVEQQDGLRIVHLSGTAYELGRQHGEALRDEVRASLHRVLGYFRGYVKIPFVGTWLANWWLDSPWKAAQPFLSADRLDELRGLAEGAGVPLWDVYRLHAVPDRTYSCANFAAWGRATAGGRLIHMRNLDWNVNAGIQDYPVVFVVRPKGKHAFVNVAWAGFLGVLTGATFTEKIFAWNGLGAWFIDAVQANDINVVVTYTLYSAVVVLLAGFVSDVLNAVLDPRVRAQK